MQYVPGKGVPHVLYKTCYQLLDFIADSYMTDRLYSNTHLSASHVIPQEDLDKYPYIAHKAPLSGAPDPEP